MGLGACLIRLTLSSSLSAGTVGLTLLSFKRRRRSTSANGFGLANPSGAAGSLRNLSTDSGIADAAAGIGSAVCGCPVLAGAIGLPPQGCGWVIGVRRSRVCADPSGCDGTEVVPPEEPATGRDRNPANQ